jgi:hypothetical protein
MPFTAVVYQAAITKDEDYFNLLLLNQVIKAYCPMGIIVLRRALTNYSLLHWTIMMKVSHLSYH